ncbi:MAG: penicillin acylase family protein, partial [Natronospirillum sp.]
QNRVWRLNTETAQTTNSQSLSPLEGQLRTALQGGQTALDETDMLALQLNDSALWPQIWMAHLSTQLQALRPEAGVTADQLDQAMAVLAVPRSRALPSSSAYALAHTYRAAVQDRTLGPVLESLRLAQPNFRPELVDIQQRETLWHLVDQADAAHLPPQFDSWSALFADAARTAVQTTFNGPEPRTWGDINPTQFQHPLADRLPGLGKVLNITRDNVSGDAQVLRLQHAGYGASMRMTISPGAEQNALFHMPGSQSGHPFSPYFWRGHQDWVNGEASPLTPGVTRFQMTLIPQR